MSERSEKSRQSALCFLPSLKVFCLAALCLAAICQAGCAPRQEAMAALMPGIGDMRAAHLYLGHPSRSIELEDGATLHEWLLDSAYREQGKWVLERVPGIYHDSDGYPVDIYREVWHPARDVYKYCRIVIVADQKGRVLDKHWEGHSCADLVRYSPKQTAPGPTSRSISFFTSRP